MLYPDISGRYTVEEATAMLSDTLYAQPILFAIEYSLANIWLSKGFTPQMVLGHSLGEYAAAAVAGVIHYQSAMSLVCVRAQLTLEHKQCLGKMVALRASESTVQTAIEEANAVAAVSIAAVNGRASVVISGSPDQVDNVLAKLPDVSHKQLGVRHAFHSPSMSRILSPYMYSFSPFTLEQATIPIISTVLGEELQEEAMSVGYWVDHISRPVRYQQAVERVIELGGRTLAEFGPDLTLTHLASSMGLTSKGKSLQCVDGMAFYSNSEVSSGDQEASIAAAI